VLGLPALARAATPDTTPPVLVGLTAQPATVNVTSGPGTTALTMHVTDDSSGFSTADFGFSCSCGGTLNSPGFPTVTAGTPLNGWHTYTISVPQNTPAGTYTLHTLTLTDMAGNSVTYPSQAAWPGAVTPPAVTVTETADAAPPVVGPITFVPGSLDVTQANKNAAVDIQLSDAVPGVDHGTITVTDGTDTQSLPFDNTNRISGTPLNGVYQVTFPVTYKSTGTYTVQSVDVFDGYGNENNDTNPGGASLAVTATPDPQAPTLGTVTVSPNAVDTTSASKTVTVTANIQDSISGFSFGSADFSNGTNDVFQYFDTTNLTSGTVTNGTYSFPVTFPVNTQPGDYTLTLTLTNFQGNTSDALAVTASHTDVQVSTSPDPAGPQVTAFTLSPATVNIVNGYGGAYAHLTVTDAGSAFWYGYVNLLAPDSTPVNSYFDSSDLVSGTAQDGNYLVPISLSQPGTYTVQNVQLTNVQNSTDTVSESGSIAAVSQTGDNQAPVPGVITLQPASGDTTNGPVNVTATIPVTDAAPAGITPSGFSIGGITLTSPTGNTIAAGGTFSTSNLQSGDAQTGTYRVNLQIPQWSEKGNWTLTDVFLTDNAGNSHDYTGAALQEITGTPTVAISGPVDIKAPTVTSITPAQASIDTSAGPQEATFDVGAADDLSGVAFGDLTLTSPNGQENFGGQLTPTSGTDLSGHYTAAVDLPQYGQSGNWAISLTLWDNAGNMRTYTSADLSAAGLPGTFPVTAAPDSIPPQVASLTFDPPSVDTTNGPADALVTAHLTDNASGATDAELTLTSPNGQQSVQASLQLVGGSTTDGYWQGGLHFNQFLDAGNWTIDLTVTDLAGNTADLTGAALSTAGLPSTYAVAGPADTTPPAVTSVSISPGSVDVRTQQQTVTVALGLSDAQSGVASGTFVLEPQSGLSAAISGSFYGPPATGNGTINNGTWQVEVTIPQFVAPGTWQIDRLDVFDNAGNSHSYGTADLRVLGTTTFTVQSTPDTTPPAVSAISFSPNPADVSTGAQQVTVTVTATDAGSGVNTAFLTVASPNGNEIPLEADGFTLSSGTAQSGTWTATVSVPRYAVAGSWPVSELSITDKAFNTAVYGPDNTALPAYTPLRVTDTNPDTTAPKVTGIGIQPASVDVSHGQQDVTLDFHATDAQSGVTGVSYVATSPSGEQQLSGNIDSLFSGTPQDGHWDAVLTLGSHAEAGTWTISSVGATDAVGNSASLNGANVPATNQFTVTGTAVTVPGAPSFVTATPGNQSVTVSWGQPGDDGGSPITGYVISAGGRTLATVGPNTFSTTVTGLPNGSPITIQVAATNSAGSGPTASANSVTPTASAPAAPATPTAQIGDTQITLSWSVPDDGGSPITGYDISVSPAPAHQTSPIHVGAATTTAVITGLTDNTTYTFAVQADNAIGSSGFSPSVAATPIALPGAPTISGAVPGDKSVRLTWSAVAGADDYRVAVSGSLTDLGSTGTTASIANLTNGTSYAFTVAAHNAAGWGPPSTVVDATAGGQLSGLALAPSVPASGADHHAVLDLSVSWASASVPPGATGVRVCLQPGAATTPTFSSCPGGTIQDVSPSVFHVLFSSLVAGSTYRATAWLDYNNQTDFGAPASTTIGGATLSTTALAKITDGAGVALSAKLLAAGTSTALAGQPLTLWQQPAGAAAWSLVTAAVFHTNASGVVTDSVKPSVTTVYEWRYAGTAAHLATVGNETVDVAFAVTEHATTLSVRLGATTYLYGTVAPLAKGQFVYLQKSGVTQSSRAQIVFQKLPNGITTWGYRLAFKAAARGVYLLRVYKPAGPQNLAGYGATLKLVVS
jgi:hypothetical protein